MHPEHDSGFDLTGRDRCCCRVQRGAGTRLASVDHCSADLMRPAGGEDDGTSHVGSLGPNRLFAADPQLIDGRGVEPRTAQSIRGDVGCEINRVPAAERTAGSSKRGTACAQGEWHGVILLHCRS